MWVREINDPIAIDGDTARDACRAIDPAATRWPCRRRSTPQQPEAYQQPAGQGNGIRKTDDHWVARPPRPMYVIRMTCSDGDTTSTEYANAGGKQPSAPRARSTSQPLQLTRIRNRSNFQCSLVPIGCNRHFERLILAIGLTTIEFSCLSVGSPHATLAL